MKKTEYAKFVEMHMFSLGNNDVVEDPDKDFIVFQKQDFLEVFPVRSIFS